ncbi:MAG: hypothetical protein NTY59_16445, partial [Alphaproteobacteria bacterium]|nr:hypothetical protein [Alphaproteobacteria bacterium]
TSLRLPFVPRTKDCLTTGWILLRRSRTSPPLQWQTLSPPCTHAGGAQVIIDSDTVIIQPDVAEAHRPKPAAVSGGDVDGPAGTPPAPGGDPTGTTPVAPVPVAEKNPTRFSGTVMISPDRPARVMHQIVEAIVEQLTTMAGSEVTLRLEIEAEVPSGLDRAKVRTLIENATTLGFIEKVVK